MVLGLWYVAPGRVDLRPIETKGLSPGSLRLRARYSGVSRGTERLIFQGQVPESEWSRMRCPHQIGDFPFPVLYGYAFVGQIVAGGGELQGRDVFALAPHAESFELPAEAVTPLPADVPPERAPLAANMETAVNLVWDSGASLGDRVTVVGAGVLGCLAAYLFARIPGTAVTLVDRQPARAEVARRLGCAFALPDAVPAAQDLAVNASAAAAGLQSALDCLGEEGQAVEASWYGTKTVELGLGGAFHARRLSLRSSQVGQLPPARRPRWTYARRLALALSLLNDPALDCLIDREVAFADLPDALPAILGPDEGGLMTRVSYATQSRDS